MKAAVHPRGREGDSFVNKEGGGKRGGGGEKHPGRVGRCVGGSNERGSKLRQKIKKELPIRNDRVQKERGGGGGKKRGERGIRRFVSKKNRLKEVGPVMKNSREITDLPRKGGRGKNNKLLTRQEKFGKGELPDTGSWKENPE